MGRVHPEWSVSETEYPEDASAAARLRFLLRYAILAPSGHNTQPWLFHVEGEHVDLLADRSRALPVVDPDDRELTISCGAALFHLRTAARQFGHTTAVDLVPDASQPDLLARVRLGPPRAVEDYEERLFRAIPRRHTNRQAFKRWPLPLALVDALRGAVEEEGAWLHVVTDEQRDAVADLIAQGDRIQAGDKRFRRELAAWVHPNRTRSRDGIPGYGFGMSDLVSYAGPTVLRTFDWGNGRAARDRELALGSPTLAVLGTDSDDLRSWLVAGQALDHLLLRARAEEVWASYLDQPIEVSSLRPRLAEAIGENRPPQLLLRLGYGPDVEPTPRRPVEDVLRA